jgi:NADH-quinone oxidoreductase subunit J
LTPPVPPLAVNLPPLWEAWPLLLPLALGGVGIFLLLPRPRGGSRLAGAGLGLLALVLAAVLVVRLAVDGVEGALFYLFSAVAVVSGAMLITLHHPARAALSFALVVLSSCGLFLLLAAPFLMAATIIIYAGAIIVIFLFVLMLAQQAGRSDADDRSREPGLAALTGFVLLGAILYVLRPAFDPWEEGRPTKVKLQDEKDPDKEKEVEVRPPSVDRLLERTRAARAQGSPEDIAASVGDKSELFSDYALALGDRGMPDLKARVENLSARWTGLRPRAGERVDPNTAAGKAQVEGMRGALAELEQVGLQARARLGTLTPQGDPRTAALSDLSGPPSSTPPGELRRDATGRPALPAENAAYLGRSLYTDYLVPVELGGLLLLAAAIGAIVIAHRQQAPGSPT